MERRRQPKTARARRPRRHALILASASPRRSELLAELGVRFQVKKSSAREVEPAHLSPHEICLINAYRKAAAVADRHPNAWVLGADTLVFLGTSPLGKPHDAKEAKHMLAQLQGRTHHVITGVCLMNRGRRQQLLFAESTAVKFRRLTPRQIADYLALINPLDKAGAYAIQEHGDRIVQAIEGSFSNVVGLPLERLASELERLGLSR